MNRANSRTWLRKTKALGYDPDGLLVVEVETKAQADNLNRSLYSLSRRALMEVTGGPADIQFICLKGQRQGPGAKPGGAPDAGQVRAPVQVLRQVRRTDEGTTEHPKQAI